MRRQYKLGTHELYRYLQLRDYYKKEIRSDFSKVLNNIIEIYTKTYQESNIRIISALYQGFIKNDKHSTKYIKVKWEEELHIQISDEDWHDMWRTHHSSASLRTWREFSWKNLIRFFITREVKSRQKCW